MLSSMHTQANSLLTYELVFASETVETLCISLFLAGFVPAAISICAHYNVKGPRCVALGLLRAVGPRSMSVADREVSAAAGGSR